MEQKLRNNKIAWDNFKNLAPSHRKQYILWVNSAKKNETKQKRFSEAMKLLEQNKEKFGYNKFDFLYLVDSDDITDNLSKLNSKINDFFSE